MKGMKKTVDDIRQCLSGRTIDYLVQCQNGPPTGEVHLNADGWDLLLLLPHRSQRLT